MAKQTLAQKKDLTQEMLKSRVRYDEETGNLLRVESTGNGGRWAVGTIVGTKDKDGYLCTCMFGQYYKLHHLVWLYHYGYLPEMIDHINREPGDNRIENLREADKRINAINTGKQKNNTSGVRGVSWDKRQGKWEAYIHHHGKKHNLGFYDDLEDAATARKNAEIQSKDYTKYGRDKDNTSRFSIL